MTGRSRKAGEGGNGGVDTVRLGTHVQTQERAYPADAGPLGVQLVLGVDKRIC